MSAVARPTIPTPDQLLCERCGYVLTGLPPSTNCPECGTPVTESSPSLRHPTPWEDPNDPRPAPLRFLLSTTAVTFHPRAFYRSLATRLPNHAPRTFALLHWTLTSLLLGTAVYLHSRWVSTFSDLLLRYGLLAAAAITLGIFCSLALTTHLAARLTKWEAAYRGLRLPMPVVLRAMQYHAAHYLPVSLLVLATVLGFHYLTDRSAEVTYLYTLCGEVILAAAYLFKTYWTGMRNVMYANA